MTQQSNSNIVEFGKKSEEKNDQKLETAQVGFIEESLVAETLDRHQVAVLGRLEGDLKLLEKYLTKKEDLAETQEDKVAESIEGQSDLPVEELGRMAHSAVENTKEVSTNVSNATELIEKYSGRILIIDLKSLEGSGIPINEASNEKPFLITQSAGEELYTKFESAGNTVEDIMVAGAKKGFRVKNVEEGTDLIFVFGEGYEKKENNIENQDKLAA